MNWKQVVLLSVVWVVAGAVVCMGRAPAGETFGTSAVVSVLILFFGD